MTKLTEIGRIGDNGHHAVALVERGLELDDGHVHHLRHRKQETIALVWHHRQKTAMTEHALIKVSNMLIETILLTI